MHTQRAADRKCLCPYYSGTGHLKFLNLGLESERLGPFHTKFTEMFMLTIIVVARSADVGKHAHTAYVDSKQDLQQQVF